MMFSQLPYSVLKKIVDNSPDGIYLLDPNQQIIYVNHIISSFHRTHSHISLIGQEIGQLPASCRQPFRSINKVLTELKPFCFEQKFPNGKIIATSTIPLFDDAGQLEYIMVVVKNITKSQEIQQKLFQSQKLLDRYSKELEALRSREIDIPDFISQGPRMLHLMATVLRIAQVDSTVLILGESGSGKSHLAKYIHKNSPRSTKPFIAVNCATIPAELMESEMFGYTKGAFTGASNNGNIGLIELASEGTLFLDEIGELPLRMQAKLLQVLQENQYYKVGGRQVQQVTCRIITATNRDIHEMIAKRQFREDLYYRLNIFELEVPPLRERKEEIVALSLYFLKLFNLKYHRNRQLSNHVLDLFLQYSWPGNARELENLIERLVVVNKSRIITDDDLPNDIRNPSVPPDNFEQTMFTAKETTILPELKEITSFDEAIEEYEKRIIVNACKKYNSSYEVAKNLKISQSKASRLIRKYTDKKPKLTPVNQKTAEA